MIFLALALWVPGTLANAQVTHKNPVYSPQNATEQGWGMVKTRFYATLDNTASDSEFHLLVNDQPVSVPAGGPQRLESDFPIVATFDDGTGNSVSRELPNGQTATIGIDRETRRWNLFPGNATESGATTDSEPRPLNVPEPPIEA